MAGQKKKLRYTEQTPWFPKYYIASIGIGNCVQKTSKYISAMLFLDKDFYPIIFIKKEIDFQNPSGRGQA